MKRIIYGLVLVGFTLAGCLHHKSKKEKHLRSLEKLVQPIVEKYKEEKYKNEEAKVAQEPIQEDKEEPKEEALPQVDPTSPEDIKKNRSIWWILD